MLNFGLVIYIALGALLFHSIGEFDEQKDSRTFQNAQQDKNATSLSSISSADHLRRLRSNSVRRMWNITNQLNILYESNWTELILVELMEFERIFVESLEQVSRQQQQQDEESDEEFEGEFDGIDESKKANKDDRGKLQLARSRRQLNGRRLRSIKRSFVHSLATITTMGESTFN